MKIAIVGAGAIGSIAAAYLTKAGVDVLLIGRDDHVSAIKKNGLRISGVRGDERIQVRAKIKLDEECDLRGGILAPGTCERF